jgi:4-amino-4-deoxy-L-arabinose transferase-like glycosyltransferase
VQKNYWIYLALTLLALGLFGALDILDLRGEEPRRALVAWEMVLRNDYLLPTIQGWPYYNKPPLFNWVLIAFFKIAGGFEVWAVRLPSLLALVAMTIIHYRLVSKWVDAKVALWSAFFMLTAAHHLFFATVVSGELDLFYSLIVYLQIVLIFYAFQRSLWLVLFSLSYLLLSLGFLTKGLPSIVFQGFTFLALAITKKQWKWLFSWQHILGAIIGVLPIILFFSLYEQAHGKASLYLFNLLEEATQKSAGERSIQDILVHLVSFPFTMLVDYLPWGLILLLLPFAKMKQVVRQNEFLQFSLLFIVANIWIYWISPGTRQRYLYMFLPFIMVLLAAFYEAREKNIKPKIIITLILILAAGRVAYNYTILPFQQRTMKSLKVYREVHQLAMESSKDTPLHTFGQPDTIYVSPSFAGMSLLNDTIYIPQYYPYQVPLNLSLAKGHIIPYDTIAQPGITYMTTDSLIVEDAANILHYRKVWGDEELRIVRFDRPVKPIVVEE